MVKLKKLHLKNYCGFQSSCFDFCENGKPKEVACFFGANGTGKSTLLEAIDILASAHRFYQKDTDLLFCRRTFNPDYDPGIFEYKLAYAKGSSFATEEYKKNILSSLKQMKITATKLSAECRNPER
jgi:AAA15 family ATPase/GTPase